MANHRGNDGSTACRAGCDVTCRPLMHEPDGDTTTPERRDWAKLPRDLAAKIAGRLLGIDVSEYIRFRAVCKPWRRSTDDPRAAGVLDSRFFSRNWVMLPNFGKDDAPRRLLNVATGASIADDFPELSGHHPLGCTDGLLVLENEDAPSGGGIRLFNPLTHAVTDLPDLSSSAPVAALKGPMTLFGTGLAYMGFCVIDGPTVVAFLAGKVPILAFVRPGESHWALADASAITCDARKVSVLSLRGGFYLSMPTGDVLAVELQPLPRLVHVARTNTTTAPPVAATVPPTIRSCYLAPSGNDDGAGMLMIMVHATGDEDEVRERIEQVEVFEVDIDGRRLVPKSSVGAERALFVGLVRALSVSTKLFPSIGGSANAVYFCHGQVFGLEMVRVFHMDKGRVEPGVDFESIGRMHVQGPFNLDVYLACCVDVFFLT